tara:strand:+ start:2750 stop:3262 length:513 start_codon:yes stop_codon:yes gene_type:complete
VYECLVLILFYLTTVSNFSQITEEEIGLFDFENNLIDGSVAPASAEIIPMHGVIYKKRPEAGSVLHTHSKFATANAVANKTIPVAYEAMVRFVFAESIPVAQYGPRGSQESIENIATTLDGTNPSRAITSLKGKFVARLDPEDFQPVINASATTLGIPAISTERLLNTIK